MPYRASISRIDGPEPCRPARPPGLRVAFCMPPKRPPVALAVVMAPRRRGDVPEVVAITTGRGGVTSGTMRALWSSNVGVLGLSVAAGADPTTGLSVAGGGATCPEARQ